MRHARARTVQLDLRYEPSQVVIQILDDGTAADPHPAPTVRMGTASAACGSGPWHCLDSSSAGPHPDGGFQVRCALHP